MADGPGMFRPPPAPTAIALAAIAMPSCSFHSTATRWNGHLGADGQPVFVLTSSYVGMNFVIMVPLCGRITIGEMVDEATRRITEQGGSHLRLVETETNNYWYGVPPLSWFFSPVVTSISFEYRPSAEALARAAAADAPAGRPGQGAPSSQEPAAVVPPR